MSAILYQPEVLGLKPYEPRGTRRRIIDHVQEILGLYEKSLPLTVRQIYYRLVATHDHYPKEPKFYKQLVSTLALARRGGLIPFEAIRDDGVRNAITGTGYSNLEDFKRAVEQAAANYNRDLFDGQSKQVFVWCEAAGMLPQLQQACAGLPVQIRSSGGMDSVTAKYDLARDCIGKTSVVLHVGDYDPTGLSIFHQLALDVPQMMFDMGESKVRYECRRITIEPQHVAEFGLLTGQIKSTDTTKRWYPGINGNPYATCEAEALPPDLLSKLVRTAVEAEIDLDAVHDLTLEQIAERSLAVEAVQSLNFGEAA